MKIDQIKTLEDLRKYLNEYKLEKGQRSLHRAIQNSKRLKDLIDKYTEGEEDLSHSAKSELISQGINRPVCAVCENKTNFERTERRFLECCSVKCAAVNIERKKKTEKTNIERYGHKCFLGSKSHQDNLRNIAQEKYGVSHYMQSEDFKEKTKHASLEKYGTERPIQSDEVRKKVSKALKKIDREKYEKKRKENSIKKYGVDHHMKVLEIFEKQQKNSYYFKDYVMPSGKIVRVQGYEDRAITELLEKYTEDELVISNSEIFDVIGAIEYSQEGKIHRYFPDIYIPKDNLIIEVKSSRTFSVNKKKNLLKREACLQKGLNFQFWIYGKDGLEKV